MAVTVGHDYRIDPTEIYYTWYLPQLISVFAYVVNKQLADAKAQMDQKDRGKVPDFIVEQYIGDKAYKQYEKSKNRKILSPLFKNTIN